MKILTICPSNRPKELIRMMDSFLTTRSDFTQIRVNYEEKSITKIFNEIFNACPDYDFYHLTNDDTIYRTNEWDIKLAQKGKISYGNDCIQGENLCTFPMIDGDIVRSIGWLQMPTLERYCGDVVWKFIGESLKILHYDPSVIIEHLWKEAEANSEINKYDMSKFAEWLPVSHKDINKIRRVLNGIS